MVGVGAAVDASGGTTPVDVDAEGVAVAAADGVVLVVGDGTQRRCQPCLLAQPAKVVADADVPPVGALAAEAAVTPIPAITVAAATTTASIRPVR